MNFLHYKIIGAPKKFKHQPRPLVRSSSLKFGQNFWNPSHETVPLKHFYLCWILLLRYIQKHRCSEKLPSEGNTCTYPVKVKYLLTIYLWLLPLLSLWAAPPLLPRLFSALKRKSLDWTGWVNFIYGKEMAMFVKPIVVPARIHSIPIRGSGSRPFGESGIRIQIKILVSKNKTIYRWKKN